MPPSSSSNSTDSGVGSARRRILEEEEEAGPSSSNSAIPNGESVVSTEDIDVKPGPSGLSNSAQLPVTNGLGKRGLKRRIVSDDEEEEDGDDQDNDDLEEVLDEDLEDSDSGPPDLSKSQDDLTKGKALKKRDVPPVLKVEPPEESSSEDEKPIRYLVKVFHFIIPFLNFFSFVFISQRRRLPVAKASVQVVKVEDVRPSSSSSNSSSISKGNSSNSGSLCEDGSTLRRSGRTRRKPKRPFDSDPSENEERDGTLGEGKRNVRNSVRTRNRGKRTVRYREDSEDRDVSKKRKVKRMHSEDDDDDDDDDHENEDPRVKQQENGTVKRYSRQSAQEAAKRLKSDFATSSDDDEAAAVPTYTKSSRGRMRKVIHPNSQEFFD